MLFIQNSFEISCVVMECRDVGVGMEKWKRNGDVYEKCTVSQYYDDQSYPVRPHLPHMGKGVVMQFALISMGYLINGDDSGMHEGMVRGSTP